MCLWSIGLIWVSTYGKMGRKKHILGIFRSCVPVHLECVPVHPSRTEHLPVHVRGVPVHPVLFFLFRPAFVLLP